MPVHVATDALQADGCGTNVQKLIADAIRIASAWYPHGIRMPFAHVCVEVWLQWQYVN